MPPPKNAAKHFRLVQRSLQDPEYDDGDPSTHWKYEAVNAPARGSNEERVLSSGVQKQRSVEGSNARRDEDEIDDMGFPIDGYDYSQHLAVIGGGTLITKHGDVLEVPKKSAFVDEETNLLPSMFEAVTLDPKAMDPDVLRAMNEAEEVDDDATVGDMAEDFMGALLEAELEVDSEQEFDYNAHIDALMAKAEAEEGEWRAPEDDDRTRRPLDDDFEKFMAGQGYENDDEFEDYDDYQQDEDDFALRKVVEEHSREEKQQKAAVAAVLSGVGHAKISEDLTFESQASTTLEAIMRDVSKMFPERPKEMWDAQTVLTTYSTTDNLPSVLSVAKPKRRERKTDDRDDDCDDLRDAVEPIDLQHLSLARARDETLEEKKSRKQMVKEQRRRRREEKASRKQVFRAEAKKQASTSRGDTNGLSVFKL